MMESNTEAAPATVQAPVSEKLSTGVFVSNVSPSAQEKTVTDFFAFCGEIKELTLRLAADGTKEAIVKFESDAAANTAMLLNSAIIVDRPINIRALTSDDIKAGGTTVAGADIQQRPSDGVSDSQRSKTSVIASLIASGYFIGEDVRRAAREIDEKHQISSQLKQKATELSTEINTSLNLSGRWSAATSWMSGTFASIDQTLGLSTGIKTVDSTLGISTKAAEVANTITVSAREVGEAARTMVVRVGEVPVIREGVDAVLTAGDVIVSNAAQLRIETEAAIEAKRPKDATAAPATEAAAETPAAAESQQPAAEVPAAAVPVVDAPATEAVKQ